jgi:hypothetical protein
VRELVVDIEDHMRAVTVQRDGADHAMPGDGQR